MIKFIYLICYLNCFLSFLALTGKSIELGMPVMVAIAAFVIEVSAASMLLIGALRGVNE